MIDGFRFRTIRSAILIFRGMGDTRTVDHLDIDAASLRCVRFICGLPWLHRWGSWFLLVLFIHGLPPFPFLRRDPEAYLNACHRRRWALSRLAFVAVRFLCVTAIYSDERILRSVGYGSALDERRNGQCSSRATVRSSTDHA